MVSAVQTFVQASVATIFVTDQVVNVLKRVIKVFMGITVTLHVALIVLIKTAFKRMVHVWPGHAL